MRLLLDTHIVLWAMQGSRALPKIARQLMDDAEVVFVSAASLWEIAIKAQLGKVDVDGSELETALGQAGFQQLPVLWSHTTALRTLPPLHHDPFDRMLIAQALTEPLRLVTHDSALAQHTNLVAVV